jgi:hypothetical protein
VIGPAGVSGPFLVACAAAVLAAVMATGLRVAVRQPA